MEILRIFRNLLYRILQDSTRDILAAQFLAPLSKTYLPWSAASIRPSGLVVILNEIFINHRTCIVECGGGVSTFYIARLLKERKGRLFTIEHNSLWADALSRELANEGLMDYSTIIPAPLCKSSFTINGCLWYDEEVIRSTLAGTKIDLLIIDGPPAFTRETQYSRYPAVPFFRDYLAEDYCIILDDIDRKGEKEILRRWEKMLGITFEPRYLDGYIAVGKTKSDTSFAT